MYISEATDRCDRCGKQDDPQHMLHGGYADHGTKGDYCEGCASALHLGGCSECGAVYEYDNASGIDERNYECPVCRAKRRDDCCGKQPH